MSDPQNNPRQDIARPKNQALFYVIIAILAALVLALWFRSESSTDLTKENAAAREKLANLQEKLAELETAEALRNQEAQAHKSQAQRLLDQVTNAQTAVEALAEQVGKWQSAQKDLALTDEGKRLAADVTLLQQYRALCEQPRKSPDIPVQLRQRLDGLKAQADEAAKRPNLPINPQFASEIAAVETEAAAALQDYRQANEQLQVLRAQAPKAVPAGETTLEAALAGLKQQEAAARLALVNEQLQKAREEEDAKAATRAAEEERKLRALQAETERRENERKRELLRLQSDQRVQSLDHDIEGAAAKKKKDQLEQEFQKDLNEIQSLLRPFITDGNTQPNGTFFIRVAGNPGPVSLGRLKASGGMAPTDDGQRRLYGITSANRTNDRELGAFPQYFGGETDWREKAATVQRAQELLIKYGDLMVEKGMLAP